MAVIKDDKDICIVENEQNYERDIPNTILF